MKNKSYSKEEVVAFTDIIRQHGFIKRGRLLVKMHIAGFREIKDRDLRAMKEYINELSPDILLGSDSVRGYFHVDSLDKYKSGLSQITNQEQDLARKKRLFILKAKCLIPEILDSEIGQERMEVI